VPVSMPTQKAAWACHPAKGLSPRVTQYASYLAGPVDSFSTVRSAPAIRMRGSPKP